MDYEREARKRIGPSENAACRLRYTLNQLGITELQVEGVFRWLEKEHKADNLFFQLQDLNRIAPTLRNGYFGVIYEQTLQGALIHGGDIDYIARQAVAPTYFDPETEKQFCLGETEHD